MKIVINMYNGITTECDLGLEHIGYVDELFLRETNKNGETYFILNEYVDVDEIMKMDVVHAESMERYLDLLDDACVMIKQDLDGNPFMEIDEKTEAEMKASLERKMRILSQLYEWYKEINRMRDFKLNHIEHHLNLKTVNKYKLKYDKEDLMQFSYEDLIGYRRRLEFEFSIQRDNRNSLTDFITTIIDTDDISEELYELCEMNNKIIELFESMKKLSNIMQKQKNKNNKYNTDKMIVTYDDYETEYDDIPF